MSRTQIAAIILLGIGVTGVVGLQRLFSHKGKQIGLPERARNDSGLIPVRTDFVTQQTQDMPIGGTALTQESAKVTVAIGSTTQFNTPTMHVRAVSKNVMDGAFVKAGDVIAELDTTAFDALVKERTATLSGKQALLTLAEKLPPQHEEDRKVELETATKELKFRQDDLEWARKGYERLQNLYDRHIATIYELYIAQGRFSDANYRLNQAETRLQLAKSALFTGPAQETATLEVAKADVAAAELNLALAQQDTRITKITTPINGYVQKMALVPNQPVIPGQVVCEVLQLDPIWVTIDYPQERIPDLHLGAPVELTLDAYPKEQFKGSVFQILPEVDARLRTIPVRISVPNGDGRIKAGVSGRARIMIHRETTTAPSVSLIELDQKSMVFVVQDGRARIREVKTGEIIQTGYVEVLDGLAPGEEIVVFGHQYLNDGERVNPNWKKWMLRG